MFLYEDEQFWKRLEAMFGHVEQEAARTRGNVSEAYAKSNSAIGLGEEAGEILGPIKKELYHGKPAAPQEIMEEMGDLLWYAMWVANLYGFTLPQAMRHNQEKLRERHPNGFRFYNSMDQES